MGEQTGMSLIERGTPERCKVGLWDDGTIAGMWSVDARVSARPDLTVVEYVRADIHLGAVETLQRIATPGQGHARALWRITMAREWLEANGHPTTCGGQ